MPSKKTKKKWPRRHAKTPPTADENLRYDFWRLPREMRDNIYDYILQSYPQAPDRPLCTTISRFTATDPATKDPLPSTACHCGTYTGPLHVNCRLHGHGLQLLHTNQQVFYEFRSRFPTINYIKIEPWGTDYLHRSDYAAISNTLFVDIKMYPLWSSRFMMDAERGRYEMSKLRDAGFGQAEYESQPRFASWVRSALGRNFNFWRIHINVKRFLNDFDISVPNLELRLDWRAASLSLDEDETLVWKSVLLPFAQAGIRTHLDVSLTPFFPDATIWDIHPDFINRDNLDPYKIVDPPMETTIGMFSFSRIDLKFSITGSGSPAFQMHHQPLQHASTSTLRNAPCASNRYWLPKR